MAQGIREWCDDLTARSGSMDRYETSLSPCFNDVAARYSNSLSSLCHLRVLPHVVPVSLISLAILWWVTISLTLRGVSLAAREFSLNSFFLLNHFFFIEFYFCLLMEKMAMMLILFFSSSSSSSIHSCLIVSVIDTWRIDMRLRHASFDAPLKFRLYLFLFVVLEMFVFEYYFFFCCCCCRCLIFSGVLERPCEMIPVPATTMAQLLLAGSMTFAACYFCLLLLLLLLLFKKKIIILKIFFYYLKKIFIIKKKLLLKKKFIGFFENFENYYNYNVYL